MTVPELVRERLGEGSVRARIPLQGEDELVVGDDRTVLYTGEGLLSGESIEEFPHAAESVSVSDGRRKTSITLDHGLDGQSEFSLPSDSLDDALSSLLAGVLSAADVTDDDESVQRVFRLGELSVIVTERRVLKQVGSAVWDEDAEVYAYENVTGLDIEEGDVSSQVIVEVAGRPQRIKAPSEDARAIRREIERALTAYYEVDTYDQFLREVEEDETDPAVDDESETETTTEPSEAVESSGGEDPAEESGDSEQSSEEVKDFSFEDVDVEGEEDQVAEELAALREAVERQNELLETHQRVLQVLVEELRE